MLAQSSGLSFLIYLVAGIVWLVSNLLQQKRAKEKAEEMKRRRLEREKDATPGGGKKERGKRESIEEELESFFGRLAGPPAEPEPTPGPQPPQHPQAPPREPARQPFERKARSSPSPYERERQPYAQPADAPSTLSHDPPAQPGKEIRARSRIDDLDMNASFKEIKELKEVKDIIQDLPEGEPAKQDPLRGVRSMMIDLSNTTIRMQTLPTQSIRPVPTETDHPNLRRKKHLRRALINAAVLENPKAMQARPFEGTH